MASTKNNTEKMVAIKLGWDAILLVPVSKAGPAMALLASCQICRSEYTGQREGKESGSHMVLQDRKIEMEMDNFDLMTQAEYDEAGKEAADFRAAKEVAEKLAELNAEAAPN